MKNVMNLKGSIVITREELEQIKAQSFKEGYAKAKSEGKPLIQEDAKTVQKKAKAKVNVNGEKKEFRATVKEDSKEEE
jgi:hypothetical protein